MDGHAPIYWGNTLYIAKLEKIKTLASETGHIDLHSFHFISLELVARVTGKSWPSLRQKVFDTSESFLGKRLSPDDLIIRLHDGFLVVFAHINNEQATALGKRLSDEVTRFFVGDASFSDLLVTSRHSPVTVEELDKKISAIKKKPSDNGSASPFPDNEVPYWQTEILDRLTLFYRPIWDSHNEIISSNSCIPQLHSDGEMHYGRDVLVGNTSLDLLRHHDLHMLRRSQKIFNNIVSHRRPCVITVTVSYKTLRDRAGQIAYFDQLSKIPKSLRKFFFVCVDQIPQGAPQGKLIEIFRPLEALCGATLAHTSPRAIRFNSFRASGVKLFGFSMLEFLHHDKQISHENESKISFFCSHAHKQKAMVYATDVNELSHIQPLKKAGVRFLSGSCIGQASTAPAPPSTLHAKNIFAA
jgi:hypothetical protein